MAPLDLATDDTCREILEHHATNITALRSDHHALILSVVAQCSALSEIDESAPTMAPPLRAHHFDSYFIWAPHAASTAVSDWARDALIA